MRVSGRDADPGAIRPDAQQVALQPLQPLQPLGPSA